MAIIYSTKYLGCYLLLLLSHLSMMALECVSYVRYFAGYGWSNSCSKHFSVNLCCENYKIIQSEGSRDDDNGWMNREMNATYIVLDHPSNQPFVHLSQPPTYLSWFCGMEMMMKWLAAFPKVTTYPPIYHSFLIKDVLRGSSTILICSFKILSGFFLPNSVPSLSRLCCLHCQEEELLY